MKESASLMGYSPVIDAWSAAAYEALFAEAPVAVVSAIRPEHETTLAVDLLVVAPTGECASLVVTPFASALGELERHGVAESLTAALSAAVATPIRVVAVSRASTPSRSLASLSTGKQGAVALYPDTTWLRAMPAPPLRAGTELDLELPLPADAPNSGVFALPETIEGAAVIGGLRYAGSFEITRSGLRFSPSRPQASSPPSRARFPATVERSEGGCWSLRTRSVGTAVSASGWVGEATWVASETRVGLRVAALRRIDPTSDSVQEGDETTMRIVDPHSAITKESARE